MVSLLRSYKGLKLVKALCSFRGKFSLLRSYKGLKLFPSPAHFLILISLLRSYKGLKRLKDMEVLVGGYEFITFL